MPAIIDQQSDELLLQSVAEGDSDCLGVLFERYHQSLYQYCFNLCRHPVMSEDLVQEIFIKLLKKAASYRGDGSFKGWMFNIARNATFDLMRQRERQSGADLDNEELEAHLIDNRCSEQIAAAKQNVELVARALAALPESSREVIWLGRFVLDNYEELGQALGCSAPNARVRMHRAMQQLHNTFTEINGAPFDD